MLHATVYAHVFFQVRIVRNLSSTADRLGPPWLMRRMVLGDPSNFYVWLPPYVPLRGPFDFTLPAMVANRLLSREVSAGGTSSSDSQFMSTFVRRIQEQLARLEEQQDAHGEVAMGATSSIDHDSIREKDEAGYAIINNVVQLASSQLHCEPPPPLPAKYTHLKLSRPVHNFRPLSLTRADLPTDYAGGGGSPPAPLAAASASDEEVTSPQAGSGTLLVIYRVVLLSWLSAA
jgi:hypothetical protein